MVEIVHDGSYSPFPSPINRRGGGFHFSCVNCELASRVQEQSSFSIACVLVFPFPFRHHFIFFGV